MLAIRPRCQDCGAPAHKSIERAHDGKLEYYCADCCFVHFNAQPRPRPMREQIHNSVRKWAVLGEQ